MEYVVSGVLRKLPHNTHIRFDYLVSVYSRHGIGYRAADNWGVCNLFTYIRLGRHDDYEKISEAIAGLRQRYLPSSHGILRLEPVSDIHLYHRYDDGYASGSDIKLVHLFSLLAITILIMAVFNFVGLSTTQFVQRYKEIGVRKIVGASRFHLIIQFILESTIPVFISLAIAAFLLECALPWFNRFTSKSLSILQFIDPTHIFGLIGFGAIIGIAAGLYPAFYLSSLKPLKTLAQQLDFSENRRLLQKALVVVQFALSIIFMVAVITIDRQLDFMQNDDLGFDSNRLIYLPLGGDLLQRQDSFKQALRSHSGIQDVAAGFLPVGFMPSTHRWNWEGKPKNDEVPMHAVFADYDYIKTLGLRLLGGRDFSPEFQDDADRAYIINESARKTMGFSNPLHKKLRYDGHGSNGLEGSVIGVVKDFHFNSFHNEIGPAVLMIRPSMNRHLCIKIDSMNVQATLKFIEDTWYSYVSNQQFEYHYLSHTIDNLYKKETLTVEIIGYVMILTLIIACLGILGLSSFMIGRRSKEIGIRKVLGASITGMVNLISREYIVLVGISNLIAWPIAWYLMNRWLSEFAYRIEVEIWTLFIIGIFTALVALLTVGFKAVQVARANPVLSLRHE
jgi:ABC-type lipoprotein release transport system permease subunit